MNSFFDIFKSIPIRNTKAGFFISSERNIILIKEVHELLKKEDIKKYDCIFNIHLHCVIIFADLYSLLDNCYATKIKYEKLLFGRLIALTIVEFLDDINILLGDLLREFKMNSLDEFESNFKILGKQYSIIKKANNNLLNRIRNNTIAHKAKDSIDLLDFINNLDVNKICKLGNETQKITNNFIRESTKVYMKIVEIESERREISNNI